MGERLNLKGKIDVARDLLASALAEHKRVTYANSLGAEAVVLTDLIWTQFTAFDIFSIDTGRLHEETYSLLEKLQRRYGRTIRVVCPDAAALEQLVARQGVNGFYSSIEARLECCRVRKVGPFRRGIAGFSAWVTGIRRSQSVERSEARDIEWDGQHGLYKVSPLLDWSDAEIWEYIRARDLPYNRLHDAGYPSIGCSPCTRAVREGETLRAGRWWWEDGSSARECGIHAR